MENDKLTMVLDEVRSEHKSHIKYLEDSLNKVYQINSESNKKYEKQYDDLCTQNKNEILSLKEELKNVRITSQKQINEAVDSSLNLMKEIGRLNQMISEKNLEIESFKQKVGVLE
ncbi:MAG: hypothetical protein GY870_09460 [archaeon]|nr:hypothetical protein [archaeon]